MSSITSHFLNYRLNVPQIVSFSPYIPLLLFIFWIGFNCSTITPIHSPKFSCLLNFVCCFLVCPLHFDKYPPAIHIPLFILLPWLQIASATIMITSLKYFLFVLANNAIFVVLMHAFEVPIVLGRLFLSPTQLSHSVLLILSNSDGFGGVFCAHYLVVPLFKVCILNRKEA